jgi:hypothetical protein
MNFDPNRTATEFVLALTSLAVTCCESAFLSTNSEVIERNIRNAKKVYAIVLRYAGRLSFSVQDVQGFEFRTIRLEKVISELEQRYFDQGKQGPSIARQNREEGLGARRFSGL